MVGTSNVKLMRSAWISDSTRPGSKVSQNTVGQPRTSARITMHIPAWWNIGATARITSSAA